MSIPAVSLCLGFLEVILKLATSSACSSGRGGGSSGTELEQNKSRHGKWCNSIHLQVNPSGEPEPSSLPALPLFLPLSLALPRSALSLSAARYADTPPGSRQQEARAAGRAGPHWSAAASAAWRPPPQRRGPADPTVASASLLPARCCSPSSSPPPSSNSQRLSPPAPGGCCVQPASSFSSLFLLLSPSFFLSLSFFPRALTFSFLSQSFPPVIQRINHSSPRS
ncbi:uncharacterized protein LOC129403426 [Sorex araneus]|uniref:uncharacterized protein LOC129403426 n=1 Tax=Sorex araneus TaxID=42254 RepID=UPI00243389D4|nr:uncharacterized protein LOC129403426 [Sorex araneus]